MTLFETHAHLCDARFDADRGEVLERARAAGVSQIVEIADAPQEWEKALGLARSHPGLALCAIGFHPHYAHEWQPASALKLAEVGSRPEVVAIGEVGLDYVKSEAPPERQAEVLRRALEVARRLDKPVILHCREAYADLCSILEGFYIKENGRGRGVASGGRFSGVVHCFSGGTKDAGRCVELGFALGVDGPVTYPKNEGLRDALRSAGLKNLVVETDSPYLPPQSLRGQRNEPANLIEIARKLAGLFGVAVEEIAAQTTRNARDLFRL